jgi:peptidoglycan hydrolase-like protein with peptidoglycan-binding domain
MKEKAPGFIIILFLVFNLTGMAGGASLQDCCHCQSDPILSLSKEPHYNELLYELQQYWFSLSLYQGKPNGYFDRNMETAVTGFQKSHHIKVTGKLDQETWGVIGTATGSGDHTEPGVFSGTGNLPNSGKLIPPPGRMEILVELNDLTLTVLVNGAPFRSFPVAIGKLDTPSPVGGWEVINKGFWVKGKTKWLGLSVPYGVFGIHGTNQPWSIGNRASKGCIRMWNHHIDLLYQWVKVGTPVYIAGDPFRDRRVIKRGLVGSDVYFLQIRLKQLGHFQGKVNGFFDYWTEAAVKKCQEELGLSVTGEISSKEYYKLRLYPTD